MKVAIVIILILLLCCCVSVLGGFGLFGNLALNGSCVWRGPFVEEGNAVKECKSAVIDNDVEDEEDTDTSELLTYIGDHSDKFTFKYDSSLDLEESYSENSLVTLSKENLVATVDSLSIIQTDYEEMDYFTCYDYAETVYSTITTMDDSNFYSDVTTIDGHDVCIYYYTSVGPSGIEIYQRQAIYQVPEDLKNYVLTQTYAVGSSNSTLLNQVYNSFEVL